MIKYIIKYSFFSVSIVLMKDWEWMKYKDQSKLTMASVNLHNITRLGVRKDFKYSKFVPGKVSLISCKFHQTYFCYVQ